MNTVPVQPFVLPFLNEAALSALLHGPLVFWGLLAVFIIWVLYTLIGIYHWITYSHASAIAIPAIGIHLAVSLTLMAYALGGALFL